MSITAWVTSGVVALVVTNVRDITELNQLRALGYAIP